MSSTEDQRSGDTNTIARPPLPLYQWLVAFSAGMGVFLVGLDIAVNVALPTITTHFQTDVRTIQWIIVSFVATRAGLAVAAGSFGDLYGFRRVFLAGVVLYTVSVTAISFSPNLASVFGLRVLQGIGAGCLYAVAPAIAGATFATGQRGRATGVVTAGYAMGTMAGTLGTGFLVGIFGWEAAFLGRVPFGIIAIVLGWVVLKDNATGTEPRSFDIAGAASLIASIVAFVLALHLGGRTGWTSQPVVGALAAAPVFLGAFVYFEFSARRPVMDLHLLRVRNFLAACLSMFFVHLGGFVIWFIFPFYVAEGLGRGPLSLGILMAIMAAAMSMAAPIAGWLSERAQPRYVALTGALMVALGLVWMGTLDGSSSLKDVGLGMAVAGSGLGLHQAAAYAMALKALPPARFGTGSGGLSLSQAMGSVISVAVGGLLFTLRTDHHTSVLTAQGLPTQGMELEALVLAFREVFRLGVVLVAVGLAVLVLTIGAPTDPQEGPQERSEA